MKKKDKEGKLEHSSLSEVQELFDKLVEKSKEAIYVVKEYKCHNCGNIVRSNYVMVFCDKCGTELIFQA